MKTTIKRKGNLTAVLGASVTLLCSAAMQGQTTPTSDQAWPQADLYYNFSKYTRINVEGTQKLEEGESVIENEIAGYFDTAPLSMVTRILRNNNDLFRQRYVVLRLGYLYSTSFKETVKSSHENRMVAAVTLRLPVTKSLLFTLRNQGDFRFFNGEFAPRYRPKFELDWDTHAGRLPITPFTSDEFFWDSRFDAWDRKEYSVGFEIPFLKRLRFASYYMYQLNSHLEPARVNIAGLVLSAFF